MTRLSGWLKQTFRGLTWSVAAKVFVINTVVAAVLDSFFENTFADLFISAQIVGFCISGALYAAANVKGRRRSTRPVILGLAVIGGSVLGTLLVLIVKGRDVSALFSQLEAVSRFAVTAGVGIGIGAIGAIVFSARTDAAEAESEWHRADAERQRLARQMTEAKLQILQAQVEPHFLYNTLANVQCLIETDPVGAGRMVDNLIRYLRAAVPQMREPGTTLGRDMEMVRAYLDIFAMRMGERLTYRIDVPAAVANINFPPMMLLTLVENAIKHGLEPQREGGSIHIRAERADGSVRVTVTDSGRGFADEIGQGVGLANVRERLATLYGDAGRLKLEENLPSGVRASIEVPA